MNYKNQTVKFTENGPSQVMYGTIVDETDTDYVISVGGSTMLFEKSKTTILEILVDNKNRSGDDNLILG